MSPLPVSPVDEVSRPTIRFEKLFEGAQTLAGNSFVYPVTTSPLIAFWKVILPPGSVGAWHEHLVPEVFVVTHGTLYVVNEINGEASMSQYAKGQAGLTDIHIRQFISNPGSETAEVIAVYLGKEDVPPTRVCSGLPDPELVNRLLFQQATETLSAFSGASDDQNAALPQLASLPLKNLGG